MAVRPDVDIDQVLQASMALVATNGLKALTLRPLADRLQTTVSALSYRLGRKDALLGAVIQAACEEDGVFLDRWLSRIIAAPRMDGVLTDLVDSVLDDMARRHAARGQFYCELLQGAATRPEIIAPLEAWKARRLGFWTAAVQGLDRPDLAEVLNAYSTDEMAHGLALGDDAAYRWLRRLNLRRICEGLISPDGADLRLFSIFYDALCDKHEAAGGRYRAAAVSDWQLRVAGRISDLIIAEGADAVTHRAIAERADVPSSTLAYHFPRQEDLLRAGLENIIVRAQGDVDRRADPAGPATEQSSMGIARGTFAIALAATHMPSLRGFAADMRRRRGENLHAQLMHDGSGRPALDRLAAQAMSITGIGQAIFLGDLKTGAQGRFTLIGRMRDSAVRMGQA